MSSRSEERRLEQREGREIDRERLYGREKQESGLDWMGYSIARGRSIRDRAVDAADGGPGMADHMESIAGWVLDREDMR